MNRDDPEWFFQLWADSFDGSASSPPYSAYQYATSNHHQQGKTSWCLKEAEIVSERLKGITHYNIQNLSFTIPDFMERRKQIPSYTIQILDEPQREASNRTWHDESQNLLSEELMATSRYLKPGLFPTPLTGMTDNRIYDICTSHVVISSLAHAEIYYLERRQLDRKKKDPRTYKLGVLTFDKPSAVLWHEYLKAFNEDYEKRNKRALERVHMIEADSTKTVAVFTIEQLTSMIMEKPMDYVGKSGEISPTRVMTAHKVTYNKAQQAAADANSQLKTQRELERAEREA